MATTTIRANINDMNAQFFKDLKSKVGKTAQVEIKLEAVEHGEGLFSEGQFWGIIDLLDWKKERREDVLKPVVIALSKMPVSAIYLFEDQLSEKLFRLDTREHANFYQQKQGDGILSADDFLYVRCAVIAEGKDFYEKVLKNPSEMPGEIDLEHLLGLAADAYQLKTGRDFDYSPLFDYETKSNLEGWKK